jgi:hypothetical protein
MPRSRAARTVGPSRNVYAIAKDVVVVLDQDVPEIDPNSVHHMPDLRDTFVPLGHHRLARRQWSARSVRLRLQKTHSPALPVRAPSLARNFNNLRGNMRPLFSSPASRT